MAFEREKMKLKAAELAAKGIYVGTSSWKYQGWFNQLYTPSRYEYRGKVATTRFERSCLAEYAQVFKTVCVDDQTVTATQTAPLNIGRSERAGGGRVLRPQGQFCQRGQARTIYNIFVVYRILVCYQLKQ